MSHRLILEERWPRLALPRVPIQAGPTPLECLEDSIARLGAEVWCKRDDQTHATYGGNKVRKLEWLLGAARAEGARTLVTIGAAGSHHVLATTIFGRRQGLDVHAVLMPQPTSAHVTLGLRAILAQGAEAHPATLAAAPATFAALVAKLRVSGKRPFAIGPGGSDGAGPLGYVEAGLELGQQLLARRAPELDRIVVPLGTGGTAVGLVVGLAAAGITTKVSAVRVTPKLVAREAALRARIEQVVERLTRLDDRFPRIVGDAQRLLEIDETQLGTGYGVPTPAAREAMRTGESLGLGLDGTYTGKAFAALLEGIRAKRWRRVLFVSTLSAADATPLAEGCPSIPHRFDALLV